MKRATIAHVGLVLVLALACGCARTRSADKPAPLFKNLGNMHHPITTTSPQAQKYFDQGLILAYGFNHAEAVRSFRAAQQLDPDCAMAYWGEALALGPNINAPMADDAVAPAWQATQKAVALMSRASAKEQAYIQALAKRYGPKAVKDRSAMDKAYMDAMRTVARHYPDDLDAQTLFAESAMDTMAWDYWQEDGEPRPLTKEVLAAIEGVLAKDPNHWGAAHYYIHAVEASSTPQRAEPYADRMAKNGPDTGHLVHMPSHIYVRVGRWSDAVTINERASESDEGYISQCRAQGFYPSLYYPHNVHFLWYAASMEGRSKQSIAAAKKMSEYVDKSHAACHAVDAGFWANAYPLGMVRFQKWDQILKLPHPAPTATYETAVWHYCQGMALLGKGKVDDAVQHAKDLSAMKDTKEVEALNYPTVPGQALVHLLAMVLEGQVAWDAGRRDEAIAMMQQAVEQQDALPYMEPPYFYYPTRHTLGAMLLEKGDAAAAEKVYRDDLHEFPNNGWALYGLMRSLEAQGKTDEAAKTRAAYEQAWKNADVKLTTTRF